MTARLRLPLQITLNRMPRPTQSLTLTRDQRRASQMAASLLLDYPGPGFAERLGAIEASVAALPAPIAAEFATFLDHARATPQAELEAQYVATFDVKRKCCLYLSYYTAGDTRRRGTALVAFLEAYRAAGWEFDADELPDFLPAVLELAARSDSPVASELIAAHREGLEVLRAALERLDSPYAAVVRAVCRSLPEIDDATRERVLALIDEGPPTETVGLSFLGNLPPFTPAGGPPEEVRT
ncbi:nitrate reductase delta subunit [Agromyces hippuratus]|uniref:Nitrate reductase delta subunit n=1 Tax=Agromyces hippuratus TaxID=286438 RepID=A0A852X3U7_9MICO|nr:nitrate reductase molybdenum cofactor assembly chaperone [Agromyces hippuratus]NYG20721.1 nitrate reductase delta subunit [Agromyces hippuratus]